FEGVCGKSVGLATVPAVTVAREARVVAIWSLSSVSDGAEETIPAFAASDNSAEQVVAGIAAALPGSLFTSREHFLGCLEGVLADERRVWSLVRRASELDTSDVDGIAEDVEHRDCTPGSTGSRLMAMTVQPV